MRRDVSSKKINSSIKRMGNSTSNSASLVQSAFNNFLSTSDNNCFSKNSITVSGNNVVVVADPGAKIGNVNAIDITGYNNASCSINQQIVQTATSILAAQSSQIAKTSNDLFNDGVIYSQDVNSASALQTIMNNITNITSNTCNSIVDTTAQNNNIVVYASSGATVGNIKGISVDSNQSSTCTISNITKQDAYNQQQGGLSQLAKNEGMFVAIALAVIACCLIGLIIIIVIFAVGGAGIFLLGGKKPPKTEEGGASPMSEEEALAEEEALLTELAKGE